MSKYIKKNLPQPNHNYFEIIDSEDKAYFLGFIVADGCILKQSSVTKKKSSNRLVIRLQERDKDILEVLNNKLTPYKNLNIIDNSKRGWQNQVCLKVHSNKLCNDLESLGVVPRKSGNEVFPLLRTDLKRHFIRGFMDGDGCVYCKTTRVKRNGEPTLANRVIFYCLSKQFLESLQEQLGGIGTIRLVKRLLPRQDIYEFVIRKTSELQYYYDFIYKESTIFLKRKKDKFLYEE